MREIRQQGPYHYVFSRYVDPVATVKPGETVAIYTDDAFESQITRAGRQALRDPRRLSQPADRADLRRGRGAG